MPPDQTPTPDQTQREAAETLFDRNVVVVAGAGTGKTTLLVNRLIHALLKEPDPIPLTQLVALTFTNKAATEMKVRLRERLIALVAPTAEQDQASSGGMVIGSDMSLRYGLTTSAVAARAATALRDLEKAQIGTLHSFSAHLLRLYPLESGLDPTFQEDDGTRQEELFTQGWEVWIDRELSRDGLHHDAWRTVLASISLEEVRSFAQSLTSELVDLTGLRKQVEEASQPPTGATPSLDPHLQTWLRELAEQGRALLSEQTPAKPRAIERLLDLGVQLLTAVADEGLCAWHGWTEAQQAQLRKGTAAKVEGWTEEEVQSAKRIIDVARALPAVNHEFFHQLLRLLLPLAEAVRQDFVTRGLVSFDGLLARTRRLLYDHPAVRERIKQEYRSVLVDEFQDTDPIQYEILIAMCEQAGQQAATWAEIALEPGKLFIVGDPKQSIYAFRRADIEAFDRVLAKVTESGGAMYRLTSNFRSDEAVLHPINGIFDRLFVPHKHIQPENVPLDPLARRRKLPIDPGVHLRLIRGEDEDSLDTERATQGEAESLARWLAEEVLRHPGIAPGHVALLFRKLTQADVYVDALRRHGVPYVIDGEKHFYRRPEVIELVNLLRVIENPHDHVALTGLLRSPLGALTDREIYELRQAQLFDYRAHAQVAQWRHPRAEDVQRLYRTLTAVHTAASCPLVELFERIFATFPILELAASSFHGEQALANLLKLQRTAASLTDRPLMTLNRFVELLVARVQEQPDEAESPLVESTDEAVRILSIHKAKGLEFPVVVLPGLHQTGGRGGRGQAITYDWSSGLYGLALGRQRTLAGLLLEDRLTEREAAERRRVLYVGMTRARELLVLTGGLTARRTRDSVLGLLHGLTGERTGVGSDHVTIGAGTVQRLVELAPPRKSVRRESTHTPTASTLDSHEVIRRWTRRTSTWEQIRATPRHLTATALAAPFLPQRAAPAGSSTSAQESGQDGALAGALARQMGLCTHWILEQWDFSGGLSDLDALIAASIRTQSLSDPQADGAQLTGVLRDLLSEFFRSSAYERLTRADIVGREIPCLLPWGEGQVMEGTIDLLYRLEDRLWVADYKTDRVSAEDAPARAGRYREQGEVYRRAVRQAYGTEEVGLEFIFLRPGVSLHY